MNDYISYLPFDMRMAILWPETKINAYQDIHDNIENTLAVSETSKRNRQEILSNAFLESMKNRQHLFYHSPFKASSEQITKFLSREFSVVKYRMNTPLLQHVSLKDFLNLPDEEEKYLSLNKSQQVFFKGKVSSFCSDILEATQMQVMATEGYFGSMTSSRDFFVFSKGKRIFVFSKERKELVTSFLVDEEASSLGLKNEFLLVRVPKKILVFNIHAPAQNAREILLSDTFTNELFCFGKNQLLCAKKTEIPKGNKTLYSFYVASLDSFVNDEIHSHFNSLKTGSYSSHLNIFSEDDDFIIVSNEKKGLKVLKLSCPLVAGSFPKAGVHKQDVKVKVLGNLALPGKHLRLLNTFYLDGCLFTATQESGKLDITCSDLATKVETKLFSEDIRNNFIKKTYFFCPKAHSIFFGVEMDSYPSGKNSFFALNLDYQSEKPIER